MTAVEVEHLRKSYGTKVAVDDVSFAVAEGEIFGLLGRNGAGKSTTVDCIAGLRAPDSGTISVLGLDPRRDPRRRQDSGFGPRGDPGLGRDTGLGPRHDPLRGQGSDPLGSVPGARRVPRPRDPGPRSRSSIDRSW